MKNIAIVLIGFGCVALVGFYLGVIKGEIKWEKDKALTGANARVLGFACLVVGLAMIATGGWMGYQVLTAPSAR